MNTAPRTHGLYGALFGTPGLICSQVLVSAGALVIEIVAGRMLAPYVGMSLYTWTAVIAVVLAGLSVGHWVGGRIAEADQQAALGRTGVLLAAGALTTCATIFLLRLFSGPITQSTGNPVMEITLLAAVVFFAPSLFAGIPSPVIASLSVLARPDQQGRAIGAIFAAGAFGAIAGTLAAGYLFISWLGTTATIILVAATYAAIAILFAVGGGRRYIVSCAALVFASAILAILAVRSAASCDEESRYYCIRVVDLSNDIGQPAKLMVLDHLGHGISVRDAPTMLVMPYVSIIDSITKARLGRPPASAFFIGGGAYTLPRAWAHDGATDVTVAEIDPKVTELATNRFWMDPANVTILHKDARRALQDSQAKFEVIVGDAFTDIAVPPHLVTREFFALVRHRLLPGGIYVMNLVDDAGRVRALSAMMATLETSFDHVEVFAESEDLQAGGRSTFVLFASSSTSNISSFREKGDQNRLFVNLRDSMLLNHSQARTPQLLTDDYAPINRLIGTGAM